MLIHIPALPHTQVTRAYDWCAYTAKIRRISGMLIQQGHQVITYCGTQFEGTGQYVTVVNDQDLAKWFDGPWNTDLVFNRWDPADPCWIEMNTAAIEAIRQRIAPGDAIGIIAGRCQQSIVDAFPGVLALEWGVGYEGVLENTHHAFESSTWRHYVYGARQWNDGRHFDVVIPNAFDPSEYSTGSDDGYLLFLGRHTPRKGTAIVTELAKKYRVISAGQEGPLPDIEYSGLVLGDEKRELLAHATAVLVPTLYVEPFGGVAVEAMLSGVPAITTDFGAFTETVSQGVTGFRCNTLQEFHQAIQAAPTIRRPAIWQYAARYGVDQVADQYDRWLQRCDLLHGDGWYST